MLIFFFPRLEKNTGKEEMRARDLFFYMWTSDLFMKRVQEDSYWTLMCLMNVQDCMMCMEKNLKKCTPIMKKGGKGRKTIKAHELWEKILESQSGDRNTIHVVQRCSKPQIKQKI
jgi:ribonucleoside-diphosphate reductase alpha chain